MAKVQVDRTGDFTVNRTCNEGRLQREVATMNFRKATQCPVWAVTTIVLAITLIGTAWPAYAASERRQTLSGTATDYTTNGFTVLPGEVLLMRGFNFRYLNDDHHITTIGVLPRTDTALVDIIFCDQNGDDPFAYEARLTKVTLAGVISPPTLYGSCGGGTCTFPLQAPPNRNYLFVLRGFELTFLGEKPGFPFPGLCTTFGCDHHLSIVGIQRRDDNIEVTYQDHNGDDDYAVSIAYSYVPRSLLQRFIVAIGTVDDAGTDHKNFDTSGAIVITGFRIGYVPVHAPNTIPHPPDNHILRFGYQLTSTGVDVFFGDKDPGTKWEYQLNFVRFK